MTLTLTLPPAAGDLAIPDPGGPDRVPEVLVERPLMASTDGVH